MLVTAISVEIRIPGCSSLKEKRYVLSGLKTRLRNKLNVAVSETDHHDKWQRTCICVVTVGTDSRFVDSVLSKAVKIIESERRIEVLEISTEHF